ncbi:MAG: carbohydrate ABC transporter permease [Acholeplasmataceae bacterium]
MNKYKVRKFMKRFFAYFTLILLSIAFIIPFLWMVSSSFKIPSDIMRTTFSLIPRNEAGNVYFTLDNYRYAIEYLDTHRLFLNTFIVATLNTVINLFLNSLAGYAFAKIEFKGKNRLFKIILTSMMIPGAVMLVPNLLIIRFLGLIDTLAALILPFTMSVYNVFLMRQTFESISVELEEAAMIEGANRFVIFTKIAMPIARPTLVVLAITTFMWNYNNFMWPLMVIDSDSKRTLALGLGNLIQAASGNPEMYPAMIAGSVLMSIPLIIIFIFFQRFIIAGINVGGVKE